MDFPKTLSVAYLNKLSACEIAVEAFEAQKARKTRIVLNLLLKQEKWDWFNWLATRLMTHKQKVAWSIFCAEQVIEIFEKKYPDDKRPRLAIEAAKAWLKKPSEQNKNAAYAAATYATAYTTYAAYAAAYAAYAASYASDAAYAAYAAAAAAAYAAAAYAAKQEMRTKCAKEAIKILFP